MSSSCGISVASLSHEVSHAKTVRKELIFMSVLFLAVVHMCFIITEKHNAKCRKILLQQGRSQNLIYIKLTVHENASNIVVSNRVNFIRQNERTGMNCAHTNTTGTIKTYQ